MSTYQPGKKQQIIRKIEESAEDSMERVARDIRDMEDDEIKHENKVNKIQINELVSQGDHQKEAAKKGSKRRQEQKKVQFAHTIEESAAEPQHDPRQEEHGVSQEIKPKVAKPPKRQQDLVPRNDGPEQRKRGKFTISGFKRSLSGLGKDLQNSARGLSGSRGRNVVDEDDSKHRVGSAAKAANGPQELGQPRPHTATAQLISEGDPKQRSGAPKMKKLSSASGAGIKKIKVLKQPLKKQANGLIPPPGKEEPQAQDLVANSRQLKISYLERESSNQQNQIEQLQKIYQIYNNDLKAALQNQSGVEQVKLDQFYLIHSKEQKSLHQRIQFLEQERDQFSAKLLISQQIYQDKMVNQQDDRDTLKEEIDEMKENLERKEYLLQFNEQKYFQYEKVLRDLILNKNTSEGVKDQLRTKIEQQELFVPKDERMISNVVNTNKELTDQITMLRQENLTMRTQLEEILERGNLARQRYGGDNDNADQGIHNFMNQTIEQLSIFQNKEVGQFRNIDISSIQKDQKYVKRLEFSIENLNEKLSKLKENLVNMKNENASLKASNDNHIYINEKLNRALQKAVNRNKERKVGKGSMVEVESMATFVESPNKSRAQEGDAQGSGSQNYNQSSQMLAGETGECSFPLRSFAVKQVMAQPLTTMQTEDEGDVYRSRRNSQDNEESKRTSSNHRNQPYDEEQEFDNQIPMGSANIFNKNSVLSNNKDTVVAQVDPGILREAKKYRDAPVQNIIIETEGDASRIDLNQIDEEIKKEKAKIDADEPQPKQEQFGGDISSIMMNPYDQNDSFTAQSQKI